MKAIEILTDLRKEYIHNCLENGRLPYKTKQVDEALAELQATQAKLDKLELNNRRYKRLQILGVAPHGTKQLEQGTVLCFTNLDSFVDKDLASIESRGEAYD